MADVSAAIDPAASLWLSAVLFGLGIVGVFARRSSLAMLMSFQLMAAASVLALAGFDAQRLARAHEAPASGQALGVLILTLCAAQGMIALGLLIARRRLERRRTEQRQIERRRTARRERGRGPLPW